MSELTHAERIKQEAADRRAAERAAYVEGLRALADLLEQHDDVPLPYDTRASAPGDNESRGLHLVGGRSAAAERLAEVLGRPVAAKVTGVDWVRLTWHLAGFAVSTLAPKDVGREKVTGIRVIGEIEVPVTEYILPLRFRPMTPATKPAFKES